MTSAPATRLMVLVFTDIEESTALKSKLGATEYSRFVTWHDDVFRRIVDSVPGAEILITLRLMRSRIVMASGV